MSRVVLLVTSPRLPAGLLTAEAWDLVRAFPVRAAVEGGQVAALRHVGVSVTVDARPDAEALLRDADEHGTAVWLAGADGDEDFARSLGMRIAREPGRAELELMYGSWDPPGARLLDAVAVMARLVAPDGDPWKRSQTHRSLAKYLLEEAYEAYDAILADDHGALREELGDVLLQIVLHSALSESAGAGWTVDDVAGGLVEKLVRRNPHVFAGAEVDGLDDIVANWERIKKEEKPRDSVLDGISPHQPTLSLAAKVLGRLDKADFEPPPLPTDTDLGGSLLRQVADAVRSGLDPEAALRVTVLDHMNRIRAAERAAQPQHEPGGDGEDADDLDGGGTLQVQ
ncbi:nucleoside triphosphate pyrophosphohydrolase [Virgisporangium ochraceum]